MFWFCYFAREKRKNFRWSLFKSQVSGLKGEACLQLQRSRLNQLCCQLEAFGSWPELPKIFFFSFLLSSFLPGSLGESICRIKWKSIPFMQTFLKQQDYVWSQEWRFMQWKPSWWFLPTQGLPRSTPPRSDEREDQAAFSEPSSIRQAFSKYSRLQ